ncbi:MAG TPA: hypothetical protein PKC11_10725, partial [Agitococcus sp.]|nr:hypothetical protein [Agitococcus sp.]
RKRIALTRRLNDKAAAQTTTRAEPKVTNQRSFNSPAPSNTKGKSSTPAKSGTMADLFAKAGVKK